MIGKVCSAWRKEALVPRAKTTGRGANGNGSIRKVTATRNGKQYVYWQARYTEGFDPGTGKQIQRSITGKTQKEVAQKLKQITLDIDNGVYQSPNKLTVGDWLDIWTGEYMGDKKYLTVKNYKAVVENHIKPALGAVKLMKLTAPAIQKFYNDLLDHGQLIPTRDEQGKILKKNGKPIYEAAPMGAKTVRNIHGVLTKALTVAVNVGYLRMNPADRVTLPRVEKKELQPLTDEQVKAFLREAELDPLGSLLIVILFTGLRESEAIGLTWDCIDFRAGTVKVCKQLQKRPLKDGGTVFAPLKNNKTRILKPAPYVMDILSKQWTIQTEQRIRAGELWRAWTNEEERQTALVYTTPEGNDVSPTSLRYHFKKLVTAIGAPNVRVHDLRHTFAVLSLQNGDDIKTVQGNLGHATAAFTLDVYGHVSERMKDNSAARMQAYIDKTTQ